MESTRIAIDYSNKEKFYTELLSEVTGILEPEWFVNLVPDVDQFPGHIVCDSASKSEIVIPMIKDGKVLGVLDIDAPVLNRFDQIDQKYLEQVVTLVLTKSIWPANLV